MGALEGNVEGSVAGVVLLLALMLLVAAYIRGHRIRVRAEESRSRARAAERLAEAEEERLEQERMRVRREARERARMVYPDLLGADEANGVGERRVRTELLDSELAKIQEALGILDEEIAQLKRVHGPFGQSEALSRLEGERRLLERLVEEDSPKYRKSSDYLEGPARIIDCGEAGKVQLYSREQVQAARQQSGFGDFLQYLADYKEAPSLANDIIRRAMEREEAERQAKLRAERAITTKLEELPPLTTRKD